MEPLVRVPQGAEKHGWMPDFWEGMALQMDITRDELMKRGIEWFTCSACGFYRPCVQLTDSQMYICRDCISLGFDSP